MNNGRIRHATETFVNNLIAGVKKLIKSNTKQIEVLSREALKYIGSITTFSQVDKTGYYTIAGCLDDTIPVQYGTLRAYLDGSEKTVEATGYYGSDIVQCSAAYNNNTKQWKWKQSATTTKTDILFPYDSGVVDYDDTYGSIISKDSIGRVVINLYCKKTNGQFAIGMNGVATLPAGFRPKKHIQIDTKEGGYFTIYSTGVIALYTPVQIPYAYTSVAFDGI